MELSAWLGALAQVVQSFLQGGRAAAGPAQRLPNSLGSTVTRAARGGPQVAMRAARVPIRLASSERRRTGMTTGSQARWAAWPTLRASWASPNGLVTRSRKVEPATACSGPKTFSPLALIALTERS